METKERDCINELRYMAERERADEIAEYSAEIRSEFAFSIKTERLIGEVLIQEAERNCPAAGELLRKNHADRYIEALNLIDHAKKRCEAKIEDDEAAGKITGRQKIAAYATLANLVNETTKAAESLKGPEAE